MELCREWDLIGTYFQAWPEGFLDMADVVLVVDGKHLPAHSQCLASKSGVLHRMLQDCPNYSKQQPVVIKSALDRYSTAEIEVFLTHVYSNPKICTTSEAMKLLSTSDHFDCPGLTQCAVQYLDSSNAVCLVKKGKGTGALHWLQIAQQFNLSSLTKRCIEFVVQHYHAFKTDLQKQHLPPAVYLQLLETQHEFAIRDRLLVCARFLGETARRDCGCNACKHLTMTGLVD